MSLAAEVAGARITHRVVAERGERPDLTEASIVVSGGRGVGGAVGFALEALADVLGAAVGASGRRPTPGWYPHQFQVGQTGKTVSPQLYIANGISGRSSTARHADVQDHRRGRPDPEAPTVEIADFGVVGDLFTVVPELVEEIGKLAASPHRARYTCFFRIFLPATLYSARSGKERGCIHRDGPCKSCRQPCSP